MCRYVTCISSSSSSSSLLSHNRTGRKDLTEQMLEECRDSPEGINGVALEFNIPLVNIEPFDFQLLRANEHWSNAFSPYTTCRGDTFLVLFSHQYDFNS